MELRHLRYFVVVAQEVNFTRAAKRLRIAQPALSSQIKKLEQELGVRLFERVGRGVRLTEAGQLLLEEARHHFVQIEQTVRVVQETGHGEVGRLSLGSYLRLPTTFFRRSCASLGTAFPRWNSFCTSSCRTKRCKGCTMGEST